MKLVILSQYFYPETGAPQNRLLELAEIFNEHGWEISVVTAMPNYPGGKIFDNYLGKFCTKEKVKNIEVIRYWLYASNSLKSIPRIISMMTFSITSLFSVNYLRKTKPEYLLVESPPLLLGISALILTKICGAKMIMNVSDIWPMTAKELGSIKDGFLYRQLEKLERYLYRNSFLCTGQSEEITEHIKKSGGKNVYLFRNGVDVKRFEQSFPKEITDRKLKIVYAGLIGVAQGIPAIASGIDFAEAGAELHIYGEGGEKKILEEFIINNPGRNVYLHESVSREEIPDMLKNYDCALIPLTKNIYGAVPSKIYEAMASGLPILFSGTGEGAKIISEYETGLVSSPKNFKELYENIKRMKNSPDLWKKFSDNGIRTSGNKFDRIKIIKDFSDELTKHS